jgi:hypothetical protein
MADHSSFYPALPAARQPASSSGSSSMMRRRGSFPPHSDFKTESEMRELKRQAIAKTGPVTSSPFPPPTLSPDSTVSYDRWY